MTRLKVRWAGGPAVAAFLLGCPPASLAQAIELMPFGGYRFGGDFFELITGQPVDLDGAPVVGLVFDVPLSRGSQFEGLFTRQQATVTVPSRPSGVPTRWPLTVDHWQGGGLQEFPRSGAVRPFLTGMLGLTRYGTTGDSEIRFTIGAGGGVKLFPTRHAGVRLDSRFFATFADAQGEAIACTPGVCLVAFDADMVWQAEFTAGLVLKFP